MKNREEFTIGQMKYYLSCDKLYRYIMEVSRAQMLNCSNVETFAIPSAELHESADALCEYTGVRHFDMFMACGLEVLIGINEKESKCYFIACV